MLSESVGFIAKRLYIIAQGFIEALGYSLEPLRGKSDARSAKFVPGPESFRGQCFAPKGTPVRAMNLGLKGAGWLRYSNHFVTPRSEFDTRTGLVVRVNASEPRQVAIL